jgi:D-alanyl-D-alanine carboxypeptidase
MNHSPFQNLLEKFLRPSESNPIHYVSAQMQGAVRFSGAAGRLPHLGVAITERYAFRIASISKIFTATLILQLMEEGRLTLTDRIADHLKDVSYIHIKRLHRFEGYEHGSAITIEHLLGHTSGLADYITNEAFLAGVMGNPQRQWSAQAIMQRFENLDLGSKAVARPGEKMFYSDTNYLLLGVAIEQLTAKPLHQNLTERIFAPLGMDNTYLEFYQSPRGDLPLLYPYLGAASLEKVNTSFDWGGGGLVSTHADLHMFIRSLLGGHLFSKPETLAQMLDFRPENNPHFMLGTAASDYGLGIRRLHIGHYTFLGHSGSWGCVLLFDPKYDVSLTVTVNQVEHKSQLGQLVRQLLSTIH